LAKRSKKVTTLSRWETLKEEDYPDYDITDYRVILQYIDKTHAKIIIHTNLPNETEEFGSGCGGSLVLASQTLYTRCAEQGFDTLVHGRFRTKKWKKKH